MKLNSTKTGICYEVSGPVYENPDNGIWCGTTVDAKEGPCFVKLICYDHITDRMLRRNIREQAADEARALRQAGQVTPQVPRLIDDWDDEAMQAYVIIMEQLPGISLDKPKHVIGKNTVDCMRSGMIYGTAAMIDGLVDRIEEELGHSSTLIATGGMAQFITPLCKRNIILEKDLLLKGLNLIYKKNKR